MQVQTIIETSKKLPRSLTIEDSNESISDESQSNGENISLASEHNANFVGTEDEIGVTMDYNFEEVETAGDSRSVSTVRTRSTSRRNRGRSRRTSRSEAFCIACSTSWLIPFLSGVFTGLIFLIIGIVFIVYFTRLPDYVGVLFILVSIPPFCMAVNKYRTARDEAAFRRRVELRSQILRNNGNNSRENEAYRGGSLPQVDLPPSYANFAYEGTRSVLVTEGEIGNRNNSCWSISSVSGLPSYVDAVEKFSEEKLEMSSKSSFSEIEAPKYEEYDFEDRKLDKHLDKDELHQPTSNSIQSDHQLDSSASSSSAQL